MPTGYTAGILDGKITTFQEFAKQCMRAFGATIHMRDDDMSAEYREDTPSGYHIEEIEKATKQLKEIKKLSDEEIIAKKMSELENSKAYHLKSIKKAKDGFKSLSYILNDVREWEPPTSEHTGIKEFMIDQILKTIDFDCKTDYHYDLLAEIELEMKNLNAKEIRLEMISEANRSLDYHTTQYKMDVERCNNRNQWVKDFINSLEKNKIHEV